MAISTDDIIKQVEWEEDAAQSAVERALKSATKASGESALAMHFGIDWLESNLPAIESAINGAVNGSGLGRRSASSRLIGDMDFRAVAMVALAFASRACISREVAGYAYVARSLGAELLAMSAYDQAKRDFSEEVGAIGKKEKIAATVRWVADRGIDIVSHGADDAVRVGADVLGALVDIGIIGIEKEGRKNIIVAESIAGMLESSIANSIAMSHEARPTLIPPNPWKYDGNSMSGGFYGACRLQRAHMIRTTPEVQEMTNRTWSSMKPVVDAVNTLQQVAWRIDERVFNVMSSMSEVLSDGEKLMLDAAAEMLGHEKHYHVWTADYRYRLYSEAGLINPQGGDVQKSLLRAYRGSVVGTDEEVVRFFKIGIAGKFGVDDCPIPDRIKWVDEHEGEIIASANDPMGCSFWQEAEKPWQFLQACFEYAGWVRDHDGFEATVVMTPLDGKCSGIQHFSAMGRDQKGAEATCLAANNPGDSPRDIYNEVRQIVENEVEKVVRKAEKKKLASMLTRNDLLAMAWLDIGIKRGDVKRSVMTMPYSATERACFEQVLMSLNGRGVADSWDMAQFMQPILWSSIPSVVEFARKAMDWLKDASQQIVAHGAKDGRPWVEFKNPNGSVVYQVFWKIKKTKIRGGDIQVVQGRFEHGKPDMSRHKLGMSPNFIHSCDAAHMHNVINRMGRGVHLHVIHDSFGVLPADTPRLYRVVREEMVKMYKHFGLHVLRESYPFLRRAPARGSFDINEILNSEFAFL